MAQRDSDEPNSNKVCNADPVDLLLAKVPFT